MDRRRLVWGAVAVLGLVAMGPALLSPARYLAGSDFLDTFGTQWFFWWTQQALTGEGSFGHTDLRSLRAQFAFRLPNIGPGSDQVGRQSRGKPFLRDRDGSMFLQQ